VTSAETQDALTAYGELVREFHDTLDLVSAAALDNWPQLLADAAQYAAVIRELAPDARTIMDVGSGAGLPGIPLALAFPERQVWLTERRRRRAAFLNLARGRLGLTNVTVHAGDITALAGPEAAVVTAQAVSDFTSVYRLSCHLHAAEVILISSKGEEWRSESDELSVAITPVVSNAVRPRAGGDGFIVGLLLRGGVQCP